MLSQNLIFHTIVTMATVLASGALHSVSAFSNKPVTSHPHQIIAQSITHRVRLGDTLSGISYKYQISLDRLLNLNPKLRSRRNLIYVGEAIYVRGNGSTSSSGVKPQHKPRPNPVVPASRPQSPSTLPPVVTIPPPKTPTKPIAINTRRSTVFGNLPTERRAGTGRIGAKRGGVNCLANKQEQIRTLLPDTNFGWTLYDYPQFFWYFPALDTKAIDTAEVYFTLNAVEVTEEDGIIQEQLGDKPLYKTKLTQLSKDRSEIVAFALPPSSEPLEEGQEYEWEVSLECHSGTTMSITGRIKRLSTDNPELSNQLENATIENYPAILAESGVWYDALQIMTGLMKDSPEDEILWQDWHNVLQSIEFESSQDIPLQFIEPPLENASQTPNAQRIVIEL